MNQRQPDMRDGELLFDLRQQVFEKITEARGAEDAAFDVEQLADDLFVVAQRDEQFIDVHGLTALRGSRAYRARGGAVAAGIDQSMGDKGR
jgi:hypothetical protein